MSKLSLNIVEALNSSQFFKPAFDDLRSWYCWQAFLKSLYGLPLDGDEKDVFQVSTKRRAPNPRGYFESYCIVGRRGGKSRISALVAAYESILGNWQEKLSPGERGWIFIISTDRSQSQIVFGYIKDLLSRIPNIVQRETSEELHLNNGISIAVKTCSYRAGRGFSTVLIIGDEIAFWRDENSANPAAEIVISLLPGLKEGGRLIGISTPYSKYGYLYEQYKNYFAQDNADVLVWKAPTLLMHPTYSTAVIDRLIKRDKIAFTSEYEAEFRDDIANFLSEEIIRDSMKHAPLPFDATKRYYAFIDPSGGRSDSFTLAISHREAEKIIIDWVEEVKAPFDPSSVVKDFSILLKSYKIYEASSDRYAGVWPSSAFNKGGIIISTSELSASDLYLEFQPLMAMGRVEMPKDDRLLLQFQMLERRTRTGGRDAVDHPAGLHDDLANACAGVCVMAAREEYMTVEEKLRQFGPHRPGDKPDKPEVDNRSAEEIMHEFMSDGGKNARPIRVKNWWE